MNAVNVYVVRIYRRFPDEPERVEGILETPGNRETFPFRMPEELVRLIFPDKPEVKNRKSSRPTKVDGR